MKQNKTVMPKTTQQRSDDFSYMLDEYIGNVYISDIETYELLYLNRISLENLEISASEALGQKCYKIIQGKDTPCPFCNNNILNSDEFYEWEFFNPTLDRTFIIKNRIVDWKGRPAILELSHDNYSLEYKLAKKDRELEAILRTIPGGFLRLDARDMCTILWYGGSFFTTIGYTKQQFKEELCSKFTYLHPDDISRVMDIIKETIETGRDAITETRIIDHDGKIRIITMTLSYVSAENSWDGIPSVYSVGVDITKDREEQSQQRQALEDAYNATRIASAAKSNFLSSMSHDIRTPMNAIIGMTIIAQMNLNSPEKVSNCLNKITTSSQHLLGLINEILDMSKIESGKSNLMPEEINLPELIQNISDICRPLLVDKRHQFEISIGRVAHESIMVDGDRLQQVLMNLLSNAIKYTPDGGLIYLRINEMHSLITEKSHYEFIIGDNGIGISEEFLPHVFEAFSRAQDSRVNKLQGTGLGLAITENIVQMMNGTIEVKSKIDQGTEFTVSLPLEWCESEEESDAAQLAGLSVLVVDDDQLVCENTVAMLSEFGMRGFCAFSGIEAINSVIDAHGQSDDFFAVILDWVMPDMSGLDTTRAIRKELGDDIPIIIISAYDYSDIEEEFLQAGANAFISKPLFKSKVLHILKTFVTADNIVTPNPTESEKSAVLSGRRVLLVEDNVLNREIASELLKMNGMIVDEAENGKKALEIFRASEPDYYDAVLMDIQMPVMNGYEATAAIRALKRSDSHTVPILALTANAFASDIGKARNAGMNDHIAKPIDLNRMLDSLQMWINF